MDFLDALICTRCGRTHDHRTPATYCTECEAPLYARYKLEEVCDTLRKEDLKGRAPTMWRYAEVLPVCDPRNIVSLGEGWTPVLSLPTISESLQTKRLWVKDEGQMPTGTFKARGISVAVSKARELGLGKLAIASAGNAGGALALYGARAGMEVLVAMPEDTPLSMQTECRLAGAKVSLVSGTIAEAASIVREARGFFDVSTLREPYRVEGKKTMGYEVAEQFGWVLPDVIVYPTGGGTGILGMAKAFRELATMGWIGDKVPRLVSVQSETCAPIVKAFREGRERAAFWEGARTFASGLRVPRPFADFEILKELRQSGGTATSVTDEEMLACVKQFAKDGVFPCPEGASTLAGLRHLIEDGWVDKDESVLLFNTGSGMKYSELYTDLLEF